MRNIRTLCENFIKKSEGTTAIELSFVALPMTYFILGIVEVALMFTTSIVLEGATSDAARLVRTGQVQQAANAQSGQDMFETALCDQMRVLADCNDIEYEVIQVDEGFGGASAIAANFDANGSFTSAGFDPGGASDVIIIRAAYNYPIKTPIMSEFFSDRDDGTRLMMSTIVLQTEPYDFEVE